jgi:hypothetical protein
MYDNDDEKKSKFRFNFGFGNAGGNIEAESEDPWVARALAGAGATFIVLAGFTLMILAQTAQSASAKAS